MARPKANPLMRYSFEVDMWRLAVVKGSAGFMCNSLKQAIHLCHRLNMCRAAIREDSPDGFLDWDMYVPRHNGVMVNITRKEELDITKITDADGNPLTTDDWIRAAELPIHAHQRPQSIDKAAVMKLGKSEPPKETLDPSKALDHLDIAEN